MTRGWSLTVLAGLVLASVADAQSAPTPAVFRWQPGQVLTYRVEQTTMTTDTSGGMTVETVMKLNLVKRWQVLAVEPNGAATLQLSLAALRTEMRKADGETVVFDSSQPDPNNAEMARYVGQPLAVLRLDALGRLLEVKESKFGPASRFESELPFRLTLPGQALAPGLAWERAYALKPETTPGASESYAAVQQYTVKAIADGRAVIGLTTVLKTQPEAVAERIPLLALLPEGEVVFDVNSGLFRGAKLRVEKELADHNGPGSKYRFVSNYTEEAAE
jgi:hypothetical protein